MILLLGLDCPLPTLSTTRSDSREPQPRALSEKKAGVAEHPKVQDHAGLLV